MKTNNDQSAPVKLNSTFMRLVTGEASLREVIAERQAARAELLAQQDAYGRRHLKLAEESDLFGMNYCR